MYVLGDWNDSNDGQSEASAKATILSAVQDAPINGDCSDHLTIHVGSDTIVADTSLSSLNWDVTMLTTIRDTYGSGNPGR